MLEEAIVFDCDGSSLIGVLHNARTDDGSALKRVAVVNVVGGPQYRVGSHRQFVVMARMLATAGYPVFRFDYRGMGDSQGEPRTFEAIDEDISSAIDVVRSRFPGHGVVVMGLCDAASATLMYSKLATATAGVVLLNPWARSEVSLARTYTRHYYGARFLSAEFWSKVIRLDWDVKTSVSGLLANLFASARGKESETRGFFARMRIGFANLAAPTLIALSEHDLTAREFDDQVHNDPTWDALMRRSNVSVLRLAGADHTFSDATSLHAFVKALVGWLDLTAADTGELSCQ